MKTIWKFPIQPSIQIISAPGLGRILHVGSQGRLWCVWAEVDTQMLPMQRTVFICGTGNERPDEDHLCNHIGTVVDDPFVWHFYATDPKSWVQTRQVRPPWKI